jgi:flagellar hook-length control protein FliK
VPLLNGELLKGPKKEDMFIRAEQRPVLETLLSELRLTPDEIRKIVERATTSGGDLDVERLVQGVRRSDLRLTRKRFLEICHKQGIKAQRKQPDVNVASSATKPSTHAHSGITADSNEVDSPDLAAILDYHERLEMATRLRHEGAQPQQIRRLLEKLASNDHSAQEILIEGEGNNLKTEEDIQALLAKLQPRTSNQQSKNGQWARQARVMPEPTILEASDSNPRLTVQETAAAQAAKVSGYDLESHQKIWEEMVAELQTKRSVNPAEPGHGANPAKVKGNVSATIVSGEATGATVQSATPSTGGGPQSSNPAIEPHFQVVQRFVSMTVNGQSRTRLSLHPPELGQIQIEISLESNKLSATLVTETEVVKQLMESNLGQLRQHLAQHNLRLENFQVTVGTDTPQYKESHQGFLGNGRRSRQNILADKTAVSVEQELIIPDRSGVLHTGARIDLFA